MNHEKDIAHFAALILSADPQFLHVSDAERDRRRASALEQARLLLQGATPPGWKLEPVPMPVPRDPVREEAFLDPAMGGALGGDRGPPAPGWCDLLPLTHAPNPPPSPSAEGMAVEVDC